jgi:hypothetical protein
MPTHTSFVIQAFQYNLKNQIQGPWTLHTCSCTCSNTYAVYLTVMAHWPLMHLAASNMNAVCVVHNVVKLSFLRSLRLDVPQHCVMLNESTPIALRGPLFVGTTASQLAQQSIAQHVCNFLKARMAGGMFCTKQARLGVLFKDYVWNQTCSPFHVMWNQTLFWWNTRCRQQQPADLTAMLHSCCM